MQERPLRIGLYGDVDLNIIDGSSVWLTSMTQVLTGIPGVEVHLVRKTPPRRGQLIEDLNDIEPLTLWDPSSGHEKARLAGTDIVDRLLEVDSEVGFDALIIRGREACLMTARSKHWTGRLWSYVTDMPESPREMDDAIRDELGEIASGSDVFFTQTEQSRALLAQVLPEADPKLHLLHPMIPDELEPRTKAFGDTLKLVYAGKFAPGWGIEEMFNAVATVRASGHAVELHVIGDKIHDPPSDPDFKTRVTAGLSADGVFWHGGLSRRQTLDVVGSCDLALSARAEWMNASRELSTKVLEYAALGVPPIINRTLMHEELFGANYPLLVTSADELTPVITSVSARTVNLDSARDGLADVANQFTFSSARRRLTPLLERLRSERPGEVLDGRRIVVGGHDMRFAAPLIDLMNRAGAEVRLDQWNGAENDPDATEELLTWADTAIAEWCLANAVTYSEHESLPDRLLVRFHRTELTSPWPHRLNEAAVDALVFVGDHIRSAAIEEFGWQAERKVTIPNFVDELALDRPKTEAARFNIGLLGYVPQLKRLDLALDLIAEIRAIDPRYRLIVKGRPPTDFKWVWQDPLERAFFETQFDRVNNDPRLREAVTFEPADSAVPSWFQKIGHILSPSDVESFHLALIEGMCSGAVPVALEREGLGAIVGDHWVSSDIRSAANDVTSRSAVEWPAASHRAKAEMASRYSRSSTWDAWRAELMRPSAEKSVPKARGRRTAGEVAQGLDAALGDGWVERWLKAPKPAATYRYKARTPTEADIESFGRLVSGLFTPAKIFEPIEMACPPDWTENPLDNRSWDFHRHSLEWLEPVVQHAVEDASARQLFLDVLDDWALHNSKVGASRYAWNDHAAAIRTRVLLFGWFRLAEAGLLEPEDARAVAGLLGQHGDFLADDANYPEGSNHGLEMDASLIALAEMLPQFPRADVWRRVGYGRLDRYLLDNFSPLGFHLEQSPGYHSFVMQRLAGLDGFLRVNGYDTVGDLSATVDRALRVWPFLVRPDGTSPTIGDTALNVKPADWRGFVTSLTAREIPPPAESTHEAPEPTSSHLVVDDVAGYAVFTGVDPQNHAGDWDLNLVFKVAAFKSPHYHYDALSFVLYAHGRDWIVDSGYYSMEEQTPIRKYMRSAKAHNTVLVGNQDFELNRVDVTAVSRTASTDSVEASHSLVEGTILRRIAVSYDDQVVKVVDRVGAIAAETTHLFHAHPDLKVVRVSSNEVHLESRDGVACRMRFEGHRSVQILTGEDNGRLVSFYSPDYGQLEESTVVIVTVDGPDLTTQISFFQ